MSAFWWLTQHSVIPENKLRFALTARYIEPEQVDEAEHHKGHFTFLPEQIYDGKWSEPTLMQIDPGVVRLLARSDDESWLRSSLTLFCALNVYFHLYISISHESFCVLLLDDYTALYLRLYSFLTETINSMAGLIYCCKHLMFLSLPVSAFY